MALPKTRLTTARINRDDFLRRCQGEKTKKHTFMNNARAAQAEARAERVQSLFSNRPCFCRFVLVEVVLAQALLKFSKVTVVVRVVSLTCQLICFSRESISLVSEHGKMTAK